MGRPAGILGRLEAIYAPPGALSTTTKARSGWAIGEIRSGLILSDDDADDGDDDAVADDAHADANANANDDGDDDG